MYYYSTDVIQTVLVHIKEAPAGTGFFISKNYILTAYHVIENIKDKEIKLFNFSLGNSHCRLEEKFSNKDEDIAILKLIDKEFTLSTPDLFGLEVKNPQKMTAFGYLNINNDNHSSAYGDCLHILYYGNKKIREFSSEIHEPSYRGFSGGPVIVEDKIVGFLSKEAVVTGGNPSTKRFYAKLFIDPEIQKIFQENSELNGILHNRFIPKSEREYLEGLTKYKLGLSEDDGELEYQETYAYWSYIDAPKDFYIDSSPKKITELIDEYFQSIEIENRTEEEKFFSYLFIIAEYGMGKSSFTKEYSKQLSERYLKGESEEFPIYFNLKNFSVGMKYILESKYHSILESNGEFKKKKFIFILDSLDECKHISEIIIQSLFDNIRKCISEFSPIDFKVIITSRQIESVNNCIRNYSKQIHHQSISENLHQNISLYGFYEKENQFDKFIGYGSKSEKNKKSLYEELLNKGNINKEELRKPIYAYLIRKLIQQGIEVQDKSSIELYFEFINQLSYKKKYREMQGIEFNIKEEYLNRYYLHVLTALWKYGENSNQKRINIESIFPSKFIEGKDELNSVIKSFDQETKNLKFDNFSYNEEKIVSAPHKSLNEYLLAEYYLSLFICYSFDEEGRKYSKYFHYLSVLGEIKEEEIEFLDRILQELVLSIEESDQGIRARKTLFPLIVSISLKEDSKIFYSEFLANWKNEYIKKEELGKKRIEQICKENWPMKKEQLELIILNCKEIINRVHSYMINKEFHYDERIMSFSQIQPNTSMDMDKWVALYIGKILSEKIDVEFYDEKTSLSVAKMMQNWSKVDILKRYCCPIWARGLFRNLKLLGTKEKPIHFNHINFQKTLIQDNDIDFSDSIFEFVDFSNANLTEVNFSNCTFKDLSFREANLTHSKIHNITIKGFDNSEVTKNSLGIILFDAKISEEISISNKLALIFLNERILSDLHHIFYLEKYYNEKNAPKIELQSSKDLIRCGDFLKDLYKAAIEFLNKKPSDLISIYYYKKHKNQKEWKEAYPLKNYIIATFKNHTNPKTTKENLDETSENESEFSS